MTATTDTTTTPTTEANSPMTTTPPTMTPSTTSTSDRQSPPGRIRAVDVIRGEWIKFWSVRSTSLTLLGASLVTIVFGMIFSAVADSDEAAGPAALLTDPVEVALSGIGLSEMIIGVLGVLVVAGEYSTGLIRTSFAAVGRRSRVIGAKVVVVSVCTAVVMAVGVAGAVVLGQAVYAGTEETVAFTDALDTIVGTTVYLTGIALIGVALGFLLRSTAAGIATLVGAVFIGPNLLNLLPDSITDVFLKYLPSEAGSAMMSRVSDPDLLSTGAGYAVFGAWVVGLLVAAGIYVARTDA
ncbi:MAG: ABC transporter permease [Actinomycetota bacterium]